MEGQDDMIYTINDFVKRHCCATFNSAEAIDPLLNELAKLHITWQSGITVDKFSPDPCGITYCVAMTRNGTLCLMNEDTAQLIFHPTRIIPIEELIIHNLVPPECADILNLL